jgi:hypothetical protein
MIDHKKVNEIHIENGRSKITTESQARNDLPFNRLTPPWLERDNSLPFSVLSSDEFEILAFLLLLKEDPKNCDNIFYFGKTKDLGRDIFVIKDGIVELIQCKHYNENIGIGVIRKEIAKLYVNVFKKLIYPAPDKIYFYASKDFSSPGIDLLTNQTLWIKNIDQALEEFLGEAPGDELLVFCQEWWPQFVPEGGIKLTNRIKQFSDLVEEFFAIRKVVTPELLDPLNKHLKEILAYVRPSVDQVPQMMQQLVHQIEQENPGLSVTTESSFSNTIYIIRPSNPDEAILVDPPTFPDTDQGRVGREKFRQLIEEGREIELREGEFDWVPPIKGPHGGWVNKPDVFRMKPNIPSSKVPISIHLLDEIENEIEKIDLTYLSLVRRGTKEMELSIGGGQFSGNMIFTLSTEDQSKTKIDLNLDLSITRALNAYNTIRFLKHMAVPKIFEVTSPEHGFRLFRGEGVKLNFDAATYDGSETILKWLVTINNKLKTDFRYPKDAPEKEDINTIEIIAMAIEHGAVSVPSLLEGSLVLSADKVLATGLLDDWKTGQPLTINGNRVVPFMLFGKPIDLGHVSISMVNAFPVDELNYLKNIISNMSDSDEIMISLKYDKIIYEFDGLKCNS